MGRAGFWNKQKVSAARHYRSGVRAYCDKHGTTMEALISYCQRHNLSYESVVLDRTGNNRWTFQLFQEALKSPSAKQFCNSHNLSYMTFNNFKKYGFPSGSVKRKDLIQNDVPVAEELTPEETDVFDFNDLTLDDADMNTVTLDTMEVKTEENPAITVPHDKNGRIVWSMDLIEQIKSCPEGVKKCCEKLGIAYLSYQNACSKRGVSSVSNRTVPMHTGSNNDLVWTDERINDVRNAPEGTRQYCESHGLSFYGFVHACQRKGMSSFSLYNKYNKHVKPVEVESVDGIQRNSFGRIIWTDELINSILSHPDGAVNVLERNNISMSSFTCACSRRGISTKGLMLNVLPRNGKKSDAFWTVDKIREVKSEATKLGIGIYEYCRINNLSSNSYYHACRRYGVDSSIPTAKTNVQWSVELIQKAHDYMLENIDGLKKFCNEYGTTVGAYKNACKRYGMSVDVPRGVVQDTDECPVEPTVTKQVEVPVEVEPEVSREPYKKIEINIKPELKKYKSSVTITYKDGRTKTIERDEVFMFLSHNQDDIDEIKITGDCTISFA